MPESKSHRDGPLAGRVEAEPATAGRRATATAEETDGPGQAQCSNDDGYQPTIGDLAAGVAHEINNPINGIINYAQILANRLARHTGERDIADRIIAEGERIAGIVQSLLTYAGRTAWGQTRVRIDDLLADCLNLIGNQLREEGIQVQLDLPEDLPCVQVNCGQMRQVFLNIICNARNALNEKFPAGDEDKLLRITARRIPGNRGEIVRLEFHDQGTGIPADVLQRVLTPFFSTKSGGKGSGLGLSASRSIVTQHEGSMRVDSVSGSHTRVYVDLPAGGPEAPQEPPGG